MKHCSFCPGQIMADYGLFWSSADTPKSPDQRIMVISDLLYTDSYIKRRNGNYRRNGYRS